MSRNICLIVQARLSSQRVPHKMIEPLGKKSLFEIMCEKLSRPKTISPKDIFVSVYEDELIQIAQKYYLNIHKRSKESAYFDGDGSVSVMYDWWDKLPYDYAVLVSPCLPFLRLDTIEGFYNHFKTIDKDGLLGVMERKTYYWDENKKLITKKFEKSGNMNTKVVETTYEAAHCLYGGKMSSIGDGIWMGDFTKDEIDLYPIDESECFDVDYKWQMDYAKKLLE